MGTKKPSMTKTIFTTITPQTVLETLHDYLEAPVSGLYQREDVEIHCNFLVIRSVRNRFKDALATSVARLVVKAQLQGAAETNRKLEFGYGKTPPGSPPSTASLDSQFPRWWKSNRTNRVSTQTAVGERDGSQTLSSGLGRTGSGRQQQQ